MSPTLFDRLRTLAGRLDDAALAALANKGLVRRARKDLEASRPELAGEEDGAVVLRVEGQTVRLRERLADSRCTCPAGGVCRHVLTAILFIAASGQDEGPSPATLAATAGDEIAGIGDEEIERWAGAALLRRARSELEAGLRVELTDGALLVAHLPAWSLECRFVAGGGLGGSLCSCHADRACLHRVVAVLALWSARGRPMVGGVVGDVDAGLAASDEAPRTRDEIRAAAMAATERLVAEGFCRLGRSAGERLRTLATSAHGVDLPRLERALRSVADEVERWVARDASASAEAVLGRAALVHALARALDRPTPALIGRHRSRYEQAREVELIGLGAHAWRAPSGYRGLTVYFWDPAARAFCTWTDARPDSMATFEPRARFSAPGPWSGCPSPAAASHSQIRLRAAWRTRSGRVSGRSSTGMIRVGPTSLPLLPPALRRWTELGARARTALVAQLGDVDENAALVLLSPARWGKAAFDGLAQETRLPVGDDDGRVVPLVLPHGPETQAASAALEALDPTEGACVLGRVAVSRGTLTVHPISVIDPRGVVSLGLGNGRAAASLPSPIEDREAAREDAAVEVADLAEEVAEEEELPPVDLDHPVGRTLALAWQEIEAIATAGTGARQSREALGEARTRLESVGLRRAAAALAAIERAEQGASATAASLLAAAWILRVAESAFAVEQAVGELW